MNISRILSLATGFGLLASVSAFALPKASEIYPNLGIGWNLGNTMEVPSDPTAWGNIVPNAAIIDGVKAAGFNTIRIPCAWDSHTTDGVIDETWLATVKGVVDLAIADGMYVMLNSHWDNGWLEDHVFDGEGYDQTGLVTSAAAGVAAKQEKYWTQIATYFANYDEHLIFASANEPGVNDPWLSSGQWEFTDARAEVLKMFHESCLKAVRATGGNNATRTVIVQAPRTESDLAGLLKNHYPTDPAGDGYTMAEVHYYPYQLAFMGADESWGKVFYYWEDYTTGSDADHTCSGSATGSKTSIESTFGKLQKLFTDNGIPVVIGEMGIAKHYDLTGSNLEKHLEARAAWYGYTVASAKTHGLVPVIWDQGYEGTNVKNDDGTTSYNNFTIIRRQSTYGSDLGALVDSQVMDSLTTHFAAAAEFTPAEKVEVAAGDKALWVEYHSKVSTKSETGTIRFNFDGGADWSQYTAFSFQLRTEPISVTACEGDTANGCNGYAWTSVDAFGMSTKSSKWSDYHLGSMADFGDILNTVTISLDENGLNFSDKSYVTAFGINIYATQLTGSLYINNIVLQKADGTVDTLKSFDDSVLPSFAGIASGEIIDANADGTGPEVKTSIKASRAVVAQGKLLVNVQNGLVNASFTTSRSGDASAMLVNGLGQVVAAQKFTAHVGANTVQLKTGFRGPAMLIVKQGSQKYMQKVVLR